MLLNKILYNNHLIRISMYRHSRRMELHLWKQLLIYGLIFQKKLPVRHGREGYLVQT